MADFDLANPPKSQQQRINKLKRVVQSPNSYFMDVKCTGCLNITTVFSHATSQVVCPGCSQLLANSTGGKINLLPGCSFRLKQDA